ncbi:MAG: tRNA (adenosine(37)-N6)-dimethylallyltransferase MiaA [bacterium]
MIKNKINKIIVIIGATGNGKTKLAVSLARKFNGEIVSADSRQVYRGMDVGTGKDLKEYLIDKKKIPHHLIDVVNPNTEFNLAKYYKKATVAIKDIVLKNKLPIIAGGTGLYAQAIVDGYDLSSVKPDKKLRESLEKLNRDELFDRLKEINLKFANKLNESDRMNKRRLIRYIEVSNKEEIKYEKIKTENNYEFLIIGLSCSIEELRKRIYKRLVYRLEKEDMIVEVSRLHDEDDLSWEKLESFGLEYKFISYYLQEKMEYDEMVEKLNVSIGQFAKRQMSWYRRWEKQGAKIFWVNDKEEAERLVREFLF